MTFTPLWEALINAGVGGLIAVIILIGLYRIASSLGGKFIEAQQAQAKAMGEQAAAMKGLTCTIQEAMTKDNTEHREIVILLKVIMEKIERIEERVDGPTERAV